MLVGIYFSPFSMVATHQTKTITDLHWISMVLVENANIMGVY